MNINKVHTPERLEGEDFHDYRARRRMSARLAGRKTLVCKGTQAVAPAARRARRKMVQAIGIRQFKIRLRAYKASVASEGAQA